MLLSELQSKDIINLNNGDNVGRIVDVEIDNNGTIISIVAERRRFLLRLFKSNEVSFKYEQIATIGTDVILIKE